MEENSIDVEKIKETIQQLKIEILEKEEKLDELLKIINNETDENPEEEI